ncbi:hypothetical protein KJ877_05785 [bacterium]|nr:hypothetical protein [bacterium]MBU1989694.1 hypothetical protein [bacterium]
MRFIVLLICAANIVFSAPALNVVREFKQSDNTRFMAKAEGNQHLNWIRTQEGEILKYSEKSKNFEYASIKQNNLKASGTRYEKNNSIRARSIARINKIDKKELHTLWLKKQKEAEENKH